MAALDTEFSPSNVIFFRRPTTVCVFLAVNRREVCSFMTIMMWIGDAIQSHLLSMMKNTISRFTSGRSCGQLGRGNDCQTPTARCASTLGGKASGGEVACIAGNRHTKSCLSDSFVYCALATMPSCRALSLDSCGYVA